MAQVTVNAEDFKAASRALQANNFKSVAGQTVGAVLVDSANIVRRKVRARAASHRRTGKMAGRVQYSRKGAGLSTEITVRAGGPVAHLLEGGVKPHDIVARGGSGGAQLGGHGGGLTIRGSGAVNSRWAGMGSRAVRGAGADVLAIRKAVHHPGEHAVPFFKQGVADAMPEVQARIDKGAQTMVNNLEFRMKRR